MVKFGKFNKLVIKGIYVKNHRECTQRNHLFEIVLDILQNNLTSSMSNLLKVWEIQQTQIRY